MVSTTIVNASCKRVSVIAPRARALDQGALERRGRVLAASELAGAEDVERNLTRSGNALDLEPVSARSALEIAAGRVSSQTTIFAIMES